MNIRMNPSLYMKYSKVKKDYKSSYSNIET